MSTPSIALIPSGYKATKLYSQLPTNGDGDLDFARTSIANRVNEQGLIEEMGVNVPRLDYSDGGCPSLLLEPQSTNLVEYSEDFSNNSWSKSGSTVNLITGQTLSPNGGGSVYELEALSTNQPRVEDSLNVPSTDTLYTFSCYVKKINNPYIALSRFSGGQYALFDLDSETVLISVCENSSIDNVGNGWFRISITQTVLSTDSFNIWKILNATSTNPNAGVVGDKVYIWGAQAEEQPYATSYIYNNGNSAGETRTADTGSKSGLSNYINSQEGVLYVESSALVELQTTTRNLTISDGTTSNRLYLYYTTLGEFGFAAIVGNALQCNIKYNGIITNNSKIALKYKLNDYALWLDGVEVGTDSSASVWSNGTLNTLSSSLDGNKFYGKVKDLRVYDTVLTDQELTDLTTI